MSAYGSITAGALRNALAHAGIDLGTADDRLVIDLMPSRILSDSQIDEMAELRERGWTFERIARHFTALGTPVSVGSVSWQCLRVGADAPPGRRGPHPAHRSVCVRSGHIVRPFSETDDRRLLELEATGARISVIATELGRGGNSIRGRLYTLARIDARAEEVA